VAAPSEGAGSEALKLAARLLLFTVLLAVLLLFGGLVGITALGGGMVLLLASLTAGWSMLRLHDRPPGALGFYLAPSVPAECAWGLLLGGGMALLVCLAIAALGGLRWSFEAGSAAAFFSVLGQSFVFFLFPAAAEEALMRGYPLQALAERVGAFGALSSTSIVFALLHWNNPSVGAVGLVSIGAAGLFLGVVYMKTGSLWWAASAHLGWNWVLAFWVDLPVSGLEHFDTPWIAATVGAPNWLSGGSFGPEGSICAAVLLTLASVVLWRAPWPRPEGAALERDPIAPIGLGGARLRPGSDPGS
jgi:membrane protease YdiL (CAAX protease family)